MFATICSQSFTIYPKREAAQALANKLLLDDPETDYRVVANNAGFFVAIFEDGVQVHSL